MIKTKNMTPEVGDLLICKLNDAVGYILSFDRGCNRFVIKWFNKNNSYFNKYYTYSITKAILKNLYTLIKSK